MDQDKMSKLFSELRRESLSTGSIPITVTLSRLTGKDLCLIPMGRSDDGAHSQNEKVDVDTFVNGMKVFAHFLTNFAAL